LLTCIPALTTGCNEPEQPLPAGISDPASYHTLTAAIGQRNTAIWEYEQSLVGVIQETGLLTDELQVPADFGSSGSIRSTLDLQTSLDERILPEPTTVYNGIAANAYASLQTARSGASQALGAFATYAPDASPALRGLLFSLTGYTEIQLADEFCSGIPLSTLDFEHDYTYQAGSTTAEVYRAAIANFDSALVLSTDSAHLLNLARVGKGRAWLDLGQYDSAAAAVADVPDDFRYTLVATLGSGLNNASVADDEGGIGLPYISANDPRTAVSIVNRPGFTVYFPAKYVATGYSQVTIADGVEARLIEAETAIHTGSATWLTTLNALRTDGTFTTTPSNDPDSVGVIDTLWNAGTGGVAGLRPLTDPVSDTARVTMLFTERAYWLFMTGHRQGDLRRLIRNYHRDQTQVYPNGSYLPPGFGVYGTDVTVPIPFAERANHLFHGCLNREA
jgi:hypothetical protein